MYRARVQSTILILRAARHCRRPSDMRARYAGVFKLTSPSTGEAFAVKVVDRAEHVRCRVHRSRTIEML